MSNKLRITFAAVALGIALTAAPVRALPAPDFVKLVKPVSVVSGLWSRLVSLFSPSEVVIDPNGANGAGVFIDPNGGLSDNNVTIDPNGARRDTNVVVDPNGGG